MSNYGQDEFDQDEMDRGRDRLDEEDYDRDRYDVSHHAAEDFQRQFPEDDE